MFTQQSDKVTTGVSGTSVYEQQQQQLGIKIGWQCQLSPKLNTHYMKRKKEH